MADKRVGRGVAGKDGCKGVAKANVRGQGGKICFGHAVDAGESAGNSDCARAATGIC